MNKILVAIFPLIIATSAFSQANSVAKPDPAATATVVKTGPSASEIVKEKSAEIRNAVTTDDAKPVKHKAHKAKPRTKKKVRHAATTQASDTNDAGMQTQNQ